MLSRQFLPGVLWLTLVLFVPAMSGCGSKPDFDRTEIGRLYFLVSGVSDVASNAEQFKNLFAPGAAPADRTRYQKYTYQGDQQARISGETAEMTVIVRDFKSGKELAREPWTAVKVNGAWKLKTAPLP